MATVEATGSQEAPGTASSRDLAVGAVAVLLAAIALYLDAATPLGYGAGFLFIVPFLVVVFGVPRVGPLPAAAAAILLSVAGLLLSPSGIPLAIGLIGRGGFWVIFTEIPVAVALVGRAVSWLLIAGIAIVLDRHRRESREPKPLNDRYRVLFREHDAAVLVIDPADGSIVDANPAAARFFWSSPDDLRAMRIADLNGTPEGSVRPWLQGVMEGQRAPLRFAYRHASGEDRYVEVFSVPVVMEERPLLYSAVYDVTDAHRIGEALRESETRHRSLVDLLPEGMVLYGMIAGPDGQAEDFRVLDLNAAGQRMFGGTREKTIGTTLRDIYGEPVPPGFDAFLRVAETGRSELFTFAGPAGDRRFEVRLCSPATGEVAALYTEVTGRARAERAPPAPNEDLERFALVAGYDLLESLWMIISFAELLRCRSGDRLGPDDGELLESILAGARRTERLTRGLLRDARVDMRRLVLEPVDLGTALAAVEASLAYRIGEAGAAVTSDPLPVVRADRSMLEQVLAGLIGNAITFRGADTPRIHVSAVREGDWWRIRFADNGIGALAEADDGAVERLHRFHGRAGYGIGLPTVKRIIERHGGSVRVEAGRQTGSVVSFTVPAAGATEIPSG